MQHTEGRFNGLWGTPEAKRDEEIAYDRLTSSLTDTVKGNEEREEISANTEVKELEIAVPGMESSCWGGTDEVCGRDLGCVEVQVGKVTILEPPSPESSGTLDCKPALSGSILESATVCVPLV